MPALYRGILHFARDYLHAMFFYGKDFRCRQYCSFHVTDQSNHKQGHCGDVPHPKVLCPFHSTFTRGLPYVGYCQFVGLYTSRTSGLQRIQCSFHSVCTYDTHVQKALADLLIAVTPLLMSHVNQTLDSPQYRTHQRPQFPQYRVSSMLP